MAKISPKIQYDTLQLFLNSIGSSEFPKQLTDLLLQYNYDLIDIDGFFPITIQHDNHKKYSPTFISLDGSNYGIQHDLYILAFHQKGTENSLTNLPNATLEHARLLELNETFKTTITDHSYEHCYFQIIFNLDGASDHPYDHTLLVSFQQISAYAHIIYSLMNIASPHDLLNDQWKDVPLKQIRSKLYRYALNHAEISKIWMCIISTSLLIYYEIENNQDEQIHQQNIENALSPYIKVPLLFTISAVTDCFDLNNLEDQECLKHYALLYDKSKWQFWLLNWFRIYKATTLVNVEQTQAA